MAPLFTAVGRVKLGPTGSEKTFLTDPAPYDPYKWPKRASVHQGLGGSVTIQDFGVFAKDLDLTLRGDFEHSAMDLDMVTTIDGYYRSRGTLYHFTDWLGNDFTVFLSEFAHTPHSQVPLHSYSLVLRVTTIAKLFNVVYAGS
jgi:hypothetical protein